jgi:enhancing lycopene biosynthesis protein 2
MPEIFALPSDFFDTKFKKRFNMNKKFAVVLSGCGVFDGAEIHESVMTMLAIVRNKCTYDIFAPDIIQYHVVNHITGQSTNEVRNVLIESARIARGKIQNLKEYNPNNYDGIIFPGGFGVAKNLCSYALDGNECMVNPIVETAVKLTHEANKPIGALCISPVMIAKILGNIEVTIGNDKATSASIKNFGASHIETMQGEVHIDIKNKIVTTPCYMLDSNIAQVADGAENLVKAMVQLSEN